MAMQAKVAAIRGSTTHLRTLMLINLWWHSCRARKFRTSYQQLLPSFYINRITPCHDYLHLQRNNNQTGLIAAFYLQDIFTSATLCSFYVSLKGTKPQKS